MFWMCLCARYSPHFPSPDAQRIETIDKIVIRTFTIHIDIFQTTIPNVIQINVINEHSHHCSLQLNFKLQIEKMILQLFDQYHVHFNNSHSCFRCVCCILTRLNNEHRWRWWQLAEGKRNRSNFKWTSSWLRINIRIWIRYEDLQMQSCRWTFLFSCFEHSQFT